MKVRLDLRGTVYLCRFHHRLLQESEQNFFSRRPGFCATGFPQKRQGFAATESSVGLFRSIGAFGFFICTIGAVPGFFVRWKYDLTVPSEIPVSDAIFFYP